jgi:hypothetical protein
MVVNSACTSPLAQKTPTTCTVIRGTSQATFRQAGSTCQMLMFQSILAIVQGIPGFDNHEILSAIHASLPNLEQTRGNIIHTNESRVPWKEGDSLHEVQAT